MHERGHTEPARVALKSGPSGKETALPEQEQYDVVIIGSGEGGKYLAWHMARSARRTAVIERRWIGGSCPNINRLPSKNEIWSADVAHTASHAGPFGVTTGSISVDMRTVVARKRQMVDDLIAFHLKQYQASGAELIMGTARVIAPKTVEVALNAGGTRVLFARSHIVDADGVDVLLSAEIEQIEGRSGNHVRAVVRMPDGRNTLEGTDVLVAAGRTPNTRGIGLEEHGIELTDRGYIRVNNRLETTAPGFMRTRTTSETTGFMKALVGDDDRRA